MPQNHAPPTEDFAAPSWEDTYLELAATDKDAGLGPDDLERLADAAWWSGRAEEAVDTLERAYLGYLKADSKSRAAAMALRLGERALRAMEGSVAQGWLARADRLLEDEPESMVTAWAEFLRSAEALVAHGDLHQSIAHADRAIELGRAHGDADVENIARSFKGVALIKMGRLDEGLALIDESALAATTGELHAKTACDVYCLTISACRDVSDLRRSREWTERAERYMERLAIHGYPGECKVHRAELKRLQGRWSEAEEEARSACQELERFRLIDVLGAAYNEIGEVRLRLGDLTGAEQAFTTAYECGMDAQPGMARLQLANGDVAAATQSLERSLSRFGGHYDLVSRVQLLPAKVEIALAANDVDAARAATEELEQIAVDHESTMWTAAAETARGSLELALENSDAAIEHLDKAWHMWQTLGFPYESAKTRVGLGQARRAGGDESGAHLELNAALAVFRDLGADRDVALTDRLLLWEDSLPAHIVESKAFMFTDIVTSTDLIGLIGDAAWASLLEWHDRTLRALFAAHGGVVVNHTGDGFFVAFGETAPAVTCAVAIQRSLRHHRSEHGFAPSLRIGIHVAEATRGEDTYTGRGVHVAARVSAVAEGEEIVVTAESLAGISLGFPTSEPRTVTVKGIAEPLVVHTVDWS